MRITYVKLKTGISYSGPIWTWRPREGYFTIVGEDGEIRLEFDQVLSAVTPNERMSIRRIGDQDELARARCDGWVESKKE